MLESGLILFRETLEAALVVAIVLGYLSRTAQTAYRPLVWFGVAAGAAASVAVAVVFRRVAGGFEGRAEAIFEGLTMLAGAALLTTLILWMAGRSDASARLERGVEQRLARGGSRGAGLFLLVFLSILREGVETVLFLGAASFGSAANNLGGALIGLCAAVLLSYLLYRGALRLRLRTLFTALNVLLILFAAGLVARGLHELAEAGWLPPLVERLWDLNPLLPEEGTVGGLLKGLFGYNGDPSLLEVLGYAAFTAVVAVLWGRSARRAA